MMVGGIRRLTGAALAASLLTAACARGDDPARADAPPVGRERTAREARPAPVATTRRPDRPPPVTFRRTVSDRSPMRISFVGDSVAFSLTGTMQWAGGALVEERGLPWEAVAGFQGPGFGLTADVPGSNDVGRAPPPESFTGWRDNVRRVIADADPDLVVVMLGIWDSIERVVAGRPEKPGTASWRRWYTAVTSEFVGMLTARGAVVLWIPMPCVGRPELAPRLAHVNSVIRESWRAAPGRVAYADLSRAACRDGVPVAVWEADGVHFRPHDAAPIVGPVLFRELVRVVRGVDAEARPRVA
jgi:hypothetical protein